MGSSRRLHRASVATLVTLVGAATIALGAFEGLGAWIGALLVGGLLGGVATLSAIGIVASSAGVLSPSREAPVDPVTGLNGLHSSRRTSKSPSPGRFATRAWPCTRSCSTG